eukprot:TRINITY_DN45930_c0_g1_i1.p1 TRINITY_DN45930_c0_g1~~TRINITY_DN45930_c0_g1_i1.p1  ORF type:complete len:383 (+),score=39.31 TRINITY_DN45930_c0_g1_i1:131-1279(+)
MSEDDKKLFVAKLPEDIREDEMRIVFKTYGRVEDVIILDSSRSIPGQRCGFVKYEKVESARTACEVLNDVYKFREEAHEPIQVRVARSKNSGKSGDGKGRGKDDGRDRYRDMDRDMGRGRDDGRDRHRNMGKGKDEGRDRYRDTGKGKDDGRDRHRDTGKGRDYDRDRYRDTSTGSQNSKGGGYRERESRDDGFRDRKDDGYRRENYGGEYNGGSERGGGRKGGGSGGGYDRGGGGGSYDRGGSDRGYDRGGYNSDRGGHGASQSGRDHGKGGSKGGPISTKIYISNLPADIRNDAIEAVFGTYGHVEDVHIMQGRSKSGQSAAFVRYSHPQEAKNAIAAMETGYEIRPGEGNLLVKYADDGRAGKAGGGKGADDSRRSRPY